MLNKIDMMHKLFGEIPDRKCKDCQHLCSYTASHGLSASTATDWRLKWAACGLIDVAEYKGHTIVKQLKALNWKPREVVEIEGQMNLFERGEDL